LKKVRRFPPELEGAAEQTEIRTRQIPQPAAPPSSLTTLLFQAGSWWAGRKFLLAQQKPQGGP